MMKIMATLNGHGRFTVEDETEEFLFGQFAVTSMDEMRAEADKRLVKNGWRKVGHWSHSRSDGQHLWVAVENIS